MLIVCFHNELHLHWTKLDLKNSRFISNEDFWGKWLNNLPPFTIKEIEQVRLDSGKIPESTILKTLDKGRKFESERYISADTLCTKWGNEFFYVKWECKASIKREKKKVTVKWNRRNEKVESGSCACPAGNLVMGLLFEIADYSLHQLSIKQGSRRNIVHKSP